MKKSHRYFMHSAKVFYMSIQALDKQAVHEKHIRQNIRQKLGLLGLHSCANITKLTYFMS